jgi:hypothetical protein
VKLAVNAALLALEHGDPESQDVEGFSIAEVALASAVTEIMLIARHRGWDIPDAMAARNTRLRNRWRGAESKEPTVEIIRADPPPPPTGEG